RRSDTLLTSLPVQRSSFYHSGRARAHNFLYPPALRRFQKIDGSLHVVSKNLTGIACPDPIAPRDVKDVSAIFHRCINRISTEEIALDPVNRPIASLLCRSRDRPNMAANPNQQRT